MLKPSSVNDNEVRCHTQVKVTRREAIHNMISPDYTFSIFRNGNILIILNVVIKNNYFKCLLLLFCINVQTEYFQKFILNVGMEKFFGIFEGNNVLVFFSSTKFIVTVVVIFLIM